MNKSPLHLTHTEIINLLESPVGEYIRANGDLLRLRYKEAPEEIYVLELSVTHDGVCSSADAESMGRLKVQISYITPSLTFTTTNIIEENHEHV